MKAENRESCPQRDSVERKGYVGAQSTSAQEQNEQDGATLMEEILSRDNLNRAYKRVKSNHGAAGIDGMTVEEVLPWLQEHRGELLQTIYEPLFADGSYGYRPNRKATDAIFKVKEQAKHVAAAVGVMVAGIVHCYAFGAAWFVVVYTSSTGAVGVGTALLWCVIPYVIPDVCKLALAFVLANRLKRHVAV